MYCACETIIFQVGFVGGGVGVYCILEFWRGGGGGIW
jgi:hypothetical protein